MEVAAAQFARTVEALRPDLLKFARSQLRNDAWAEDAVSETVLAALEKPDSFGGRSQLKTWLVGILKFKVVDQLRRHTREATVLVDEDGEDLEELLFEADGHWRTEPGDWGGGFEAVQQRQFFEVMEACIELLPPLQGRVFMMKEWLDLESAEICKELDLTATHLWVLMHRARLRLRDCLEKRWFLDGTREPLP
jgi:RNA polymerase sigma-70 factor (ECF subfamily)